MRDVEVIEAPQAAIAALDPKRAAILAALAEPQSAAMLAARLGIPRQKVNYHLRQLEAHGLVELVEERAHGGITERVLAATARAYAIAPGELSAGADRLSARYLVAVAARLVREVGRLARRGPAATLTIDTTIGFATPQDRAAFADELTAAVTQLAAKYHHEGGRPHRVVAAAHELPQEDDE
jgi:DNA-binding transcriptional ArsR family regulator